MSMFGDILDDAAEALIRGELKHVADGMVAKGDLPSAKEQELIDGVMDAIAAGLEMWRQSQAQARTQ